MFIYRCANRRAKNISEINVSNISFGMISPFDAFSPSRHLGGHGQRQRRPPQMAFVSVLRHKVSLLRTEPTSLQQPRSIDIDIYYCWHTQYARRNARCIRSCVCRGRANASVYRTSSTIYSLPNR